MALFLNIFIILVFLIPTMLAIHYVYYRKRIVKKLNTVSKKHSPFVTVIVPFKGEDYRFRETVESLSSQEYSGDYEVLFVSSDTFGKSVDILHELVPKHPKLQFIQATNNDSVTRSDKVNNLISGINHANKESEIFLFLDSDMVVHNKWLQLMTEPLKLSDCGLSTGSAWVVSKKGGLWEKSTRFWDLLALTQVTFPWTSFARGLSMGITKKTYHQLEIEKVWNDAFHDNFSISKAVRKAKFKIYFSPYTIVEENFDLEGFQWVKWIKRQTVHTRKHYKRLWSFGFFLVTLPRILGALFFVIAMLLSLINPSYFLYTFGLISWPILHFINATILVQSVYQDAKFVKDFKNSYSERLKLVISSYFSVVHCIGSIWAVFSNNIEWRKVQYQNNKIVERVQDENQASGE